MIRDCGHIEGSDTAEISYDFRQINTAEIKKSGVKSGMKCEIKNL